MVIRNSFSLYHKNFLSNRTEKAGEDERDRLIPNEITAEETVPVENLPAWQRESLIQAEEMHQVEAEPDIPLDFLQVEEPSTKRKSGTDYDKQNRGSGYFSF